MRQSKGLDTAVAAVMLLAANALVLLTVELLCAVARTDVSGVLLGAALGCVGVDVFTLAFWPHGGYLAAAAKRRHRKMRERLGLPDHQEPGWHGPDCDCGKDHDSLR